MDLLQLFKSYISQHNLFQKKDSLLLAVSGGADSSVLVDLCSKSGYAFAIAHCNFQLRGEESDRDEHFVKELAAKYDCPFFVKKFNTNSYAKENKLSIEEAARNLRYEWFKAIMADSKSNGSDKFTCLLTAHHADDNIETVLMNFFRGTGIKGLRGILPKQENICRPLLFASRKDIEEYAAQNNIVFITDSSNASNEHTRNYFRNELIPATEKIFPAVKQNLLNNIERFADVEQVYAHQIALQKKKLLEIKGNEAFIPVLKLAKMPACRTLIHEIIRDFGFNPSQVGEVEKLLKSESGKYIVSATHRVLRNRNWLIISPITEESDAAHYIIEKDTQGVAFPGGEIKISPAKMPLSLNEGDHTAFINSDELSYPLLLRRWKKGDYFYPLGMQKKKKLSKFFSDKKLSLTEKENIWVIESARKILWVVGHRIDDRFKVQPLSTNVLKLSWRPAAP